MPSRIKFQQSLDDLKERLLMMAGMSEQAIQRSIEAIARATSRSASWCSERSLRSTGWSARSTTGAGPACNGAADGDRPALHSVGDSH